MATYQALQQKIADDLNRSDLTTQIQAAILAAVELHEAERFWFNELRQTSAFTTVQGQEFYTSADSALIASMKQLDAVTITVSGNRYPLTKRTYGLLEALSSTTTSRGQPCDYAIYGEGLRLWPIPDGAYAVALSGLRQFTALSGDTDENPWTTEAFELIRAQAKEDLNLNVLKDDAEATRASVQVAKQLKRLREETSRRLATSTLRPTQF